MGRHVSHDSEIAESQKAVIADESLVKAGRMVADPAIISGDDSKVRLHASAGGINNGPHIDRLNRK